MRDELSAFAAMRASWTASCALLVFVFCAAMWAGNVRAEDTVRAGQMGAGKPYVVSVNVRQAYDDNIFTRPDDRKIGSFKTTITPGIRFNYPLQQTLLSASYFFGATYYENRPGGDDFDFSHTFTGRINHKFSPRFEIDIRESFRYTQESEINDGINVQRRIGDGFTNSAGINGTYIWTERFSTVTGYQNTIRHFNDRLVRQNNNFVEHRVTQDFQFSVLPTTTAVVSYTYERIDFNNNATRNRDMHYALVGADHYLLPEWLVSGRVGAQFLLYDDIRITDSVNPFVSLDTRWNYLPKSFVRAGYRYSSNITDDPNFADIESHTLSLGITHYFTPKFNAGGDVIYSLGSFSQSSSINNVGNREEDTLRLQIRVGYDFTDWLSAEAGYSYDEVTSDTPGREYSRNQVYVGVTGKY